MGGLTGCLGSLDKDMAGLGVHRPSPGMKTEARIPLLLVWGQPRQRRGVPAPAAAGRRRRRGGALPARLLHQQPADRHSGRWQPLSSRAPPWACWRAATRATTSSGRGTHYLGFPDSEIDSNHDTALTLACVRGQEELVTLLFSRGTDIEHRDKNGFTLLILAATAGHDKVRKMVKTKKMCKKV